MLAVVRKHRTSVPLFKMKGDVPERIIEFIEKEFDVEVEEEDEEYVDITETEWYRDMQRNWTHGDSISVYRYKAGYTQAQLGELLGGVSRQVVCDMEKGRRGISKDMAKKLAKILKTRVEKFI
ncbi:MAG: helix-turn-helix transcriptional regulator [Proteobacteria bacterium]|nr:helix-turn-helix transcriptional regulator [Pseudomonadota bacterium]